MSGTSNNTPTSGATGKTDFTGIVNALQMLAQAIGQNGKALDAIKASLPGSLPAPSAGNALDMVRINAAGTAYEVRTPAQVASDIGVVTPPSPATVAPLVDGTAAVGTSLLYARQDHVHPAIPGWQTLASYAPSAVSSQAIPLPSGFERYRLTYQNTTVSTNGGSLGFQASINGGLTYITTSSYAQFGFYLANATTITPFLIGTTNGLLSVGLAASTSAEGVFEIVPGTASLAAMCNGRASGNINAGSWYTGQISNAIAAGAAINQLKVTVSTGTLSGTILLEGLP